MPSVLTNEQHLTARKLFADPETFAMDEAARIEKVYMGLFSFAPLKRTSDPEELMIRGARYEALAQIDNDVRARSVPETEKGDTWSVSLTGLTILCGVFLIAACTQQVVLRCK